MGNKRTMQTVDEVELSTTTTGADSSRLEALKKTIQQKLLYIVGKDPAHASIHDWYIATALAVRDRIVDRWV